MWIDEQYRIFRRGEDTKRVPLPYTDEDEMVQMDVHPRAIDQFDDDDDAGDEDGDDDDDAGHDGDRARDSGLPGSAADGPSHATCHVPTPANKRD